MHLSLRERWHELLPAAPPGALDRAGDDLLERWSEPHRAYHSPAHLAAVLDAVDLLVAEGGAGPGVDLESVRLAVWFHDAVHQGQAGSDEEASARLALEVLPGLEVARERVDEVARLVRLTATHDPGPGDAAGALLCDADLSVLGAGPTAYAGYAAAVREEYAAVPGAAFATGRAQVLRRLLALDPIYRTAAGRHRWEDAARRNLTAELARLAARGAEPAGEPAAEPAAADPRGAAG